MKQLKEDLDSTQEDRFDYADAVCILTTNITSIQMKWFQDLLPYNISVYIMIDALDRNAVTKSSFGHIQIISINSMDSKGVGYFWGGSKHIYVRNSKNNQGADCYRKYINAWDKSLLYFTESYLNPAVAF